MKHILVLAPSSFPINNSEAISNAKLIYLLAQLGYKVTVFSRISNLSSEAIYPEGSSEKKILDLKNINVKYIKVFNGKGLKSIKEHLLCWCKTGYVYRGANWSYYAIKEALKLNKKDKIDVLITRGFYTDIAGVYLSKKLGLKWIANWNDPYPLARFPHPYGKGPYCKIGNRMERLLRDIQKYSYIHTFPSARLRDYMLKYFSMISVDRTVVIPHLAHEDFMVSSKKTDSNKLRLVHAGNVSSPRSPKKFFQALQNVVKDFPNDIECIFIGRQDADFYKLVENPVLKSVVKVLPAMKYFDVMDFLSQSDISLIIEAECDEGIYLPTKFVDALQILKPVFCISPSQGTLHDYVDKFGIGYFANNSSVEEISETLRNIVMDYKQKKLPNFSISDVEYFFTKSIGQQYLQLIETM